MTAVVKKMEEKKGAFRVPLIEEVVLYMKEKKGWPDKFCKQYAEKFWNTYEASGWRLSNGNKMKSWQAAFNAQWQNPRYEQDIIFLKQCMEQNGPAVGKPMGTHGRLNEAVSDERLAKVYDYLKENKMIVLTAQEKLFIKTAYANNVEKGKAACVKTMFTNMINHGKQF
jgi:hypothetical protein